MTAAMDGSKAIFYGYFVPVSIPDVMNFGLSCRFFCSVAAQRPYRLLDTSDEDGKTSAARRVYFHKGGSASTATATMATSAARRAVDRHAERQMQRRA